MASLLGDRGAVVLSLTTAPLTASAARRYSLYTPEMQLMAETETTSGGSPAIAFEYVWLGGEPVAQIETATQTIHTYFNDHLGTPILTTNATGAVDWRVEREPYGRIFAARTGNNRHQPLSLPGQEDDGSSDRSYNIFRWYMSSSGRYTQSDPLRSEISADQVYRHWLSIAARLSGPRSGSNDVYAYAHSNPLSFTDPAGLYPCSVASTMDCERECTRKGMLFLACDTVFDCPVFEVSMCYCRASRPRTPLKAPRDCHRELAMCLRFAGSNPLKEALCLAAWVVCNEENARNAILNE